MPKEVDLTAERLYELRKAVLDIVVSKGYRRLDEPIRLASGELSLDYVDGKRALAHGPDLKLACEALLALVDEAGIVFDAVGGLTLGADPFAHGCALLSRSSWFVVRKQVKDHGTKKQIEGAELGPGARVLLVEDVVTTGGSMLEALAAIRATGAGVVFAATVVDRGDSASRRLLGEGVPYRSVLTYRDLGIGPVGNRDPRAPQESPSVDGSADVIP